MYKITKILLEKTTKSFSKVWPQKAVYYEVDGGVEHEQIPHHTVQQPPKQTGITTQPFDLEQSINFRKVSQCQEKTSIRACPFTIKNLLRHY